MAHLWVCMPFLVMWVVVPSAHVGIPDENFRKITAFLGTVIAYLLVRTWLAFRNPNWLKWEYVFPPIDIAAISMLIWLGNRDPLSNIALLYFFPIAQAAGTLNTRWAVTVSCLVLVGAALATHGLRSDEPFNTVFRYFFLIVLGSLVTLLAKASAELREALSVARDRNRMAMEMHDGVQAHLMTISKQLELAEAVAETNPSRVTELTRDSRDLARLAADELRYLVTRMRSPSLEHGFVAALKGFANNLTSRYGLELEFEEIGTSAGVSRETEHAAFRIAQEALTNAIRHAKASRVAVSIRFEQDHLTLSVKDNGVGISTAQPSGGLEGMQRRASELGGSVEVNGANGTEVVATLPLRSKSSNE
ncbi:MAG TPA: sensor histidine kinase [Fimbriimonadaceae bacterium]|nr:sensor histidine kinase [Fimbriimonadaceae bacterium]